LRLTVGPHGISNAEHDEQRRNPKAIAMQGSVNDAAPLSIDRQQDPGAYEYPVNTKEEQECQSNEDQRIGEVRNDLTRGSKLGGHVGEPLG
jgi:hypothetical protein